MANKNNYSSYRKMPIPIVRAIIQSGRQMEQDKYLPIQRSLTKFPKPPPGAKHQITWKVYEKKRLLCQLTTNTSTWSLRKTSTTLPGCVLWSDKAKIELFGHKHVAWFRIKKKDDYDKKNNQNPTVKYGGGSMMLCGWFFLQRLWTLC